jgi:hypothetical protein
MVKMMDAQLATRIMERIAIGDIVRVEVGENEWSNEKVIEKTAYSLTVRGKYNKLFLSVQCTEAYQKEMQMRMPTAAIEPPVARGRGRPKKEASGPAAPVDSPSPVRTAPQPAQRATATTWPPSEPVAQPSPAAPDVAGADADAEAMAWFGDALDAALHALRKDMVTLAEGLLNSVQAPEPTPPEPGPAPAKTCMDCEHANLTNGSCNKFKITPPMAIIAFASQRCEAFSLEEPPF